MSDLIMSELVKIQLDTKVSIVLTNGVTIKGVVGESDYPSTNMIVHDGDICWFIENSSVIAYGIHFDMEEV